MIYYRDREISLNEEEFLSVKKDINEFLDDSDKLHQPERSKREDLKFKKLADEFWNSEVTQEMLENYEEENGALKVIDKFAEWLDSRCGALNTMET